MARYGIVLYNVGRPQGTTKEEGKAQMNLQEEEQIIDAISNFDVPLIPSSTRFWMIRTKKGYFYNEFIGKRFVALAWNNIDKNTDFSEQSQDALKDSILLEYNDIKRPSTVINKCKTFIHEIKEGDILVIPSAGSNFITFAIAGNYYEDDTKTIAIEHTIIRKINSGDVDINDVSCPYKKRRHITLLRTVKNENLNYTLCRAISSYHGLNSLDAYARHILNSLYNYYIFDGTMSLVYNVTKTEPISPREINTILYGTTEILVEFVPEQCISAQLSLNSPGEIVFNIYDVLNFLKDNWKYFFGMLIFLGGGSFLTFKVPGAVDVLKSIFSAPAEYRLKKLDVTQKELEILEKKLAIYNKIKESGSDPDSLSRNLDAVISGSTSLQITPIILGEETAAEQTSENAVFESHDEEEE